MNNHNILFLFAIGILSATALGQSYSINWHTIDGGGGTSTGDVYSVSGTVGPADTGTMTGGSYSLAGGFWSVIGTVETPGAPRLTIRFTQTNTVEISWPSPSAGFALQQNSDLVTSNWTASPNPVTDTGTNQFIIVNPLGNWFYRLAKP